MATATTKTSEPVLLFGSVLAALSALFGGLAGVAFFTDNPVIVAVIAVGGIAVAAATTGLQFYVRGQVVPTDKAEAEAESRADAAVQSVLTETPVEAPVEDVVLDHVDDPDADPDAELGDFVPFADQVDESAPDPDGEAEVPAEARRALV